MHLDTCAVFDGPPRAVVAADLGLEGPVWPVPPAPRGTLTARDTWGMTEHDPRLRSGPRI